MRIAVLLATCLWLALPARSGDLLLPGGGTFFQVPVRSMEEVRFQNVVRQKYDFSCGSAAVATLLSYHYRRATGEDEVFKSMWAAGDQEKIRSVGFSMLDMKLYLQSIGFRADGFRVSLEEVHRGDQPGITLLNTKGYNHFVVVSGLDLDDQGGRRAVRESVMVADPALGLRAISREEFEEAWNGLYFIIRGKSDLAAEGFNKEEDWEVQANAPFRHALGPVGLAMFTTMLPIQGSL